MSVNRLEGRYKGECQFASLPDESRTSMLFDTGINPHPAGLAAIDYIGAR